MAPNQNYILTDARGDPVSRTYQYRKVMKPLLERKRRARINRCLDELKELMTGAFQTHESDTVTKLEKADILELTVHHLHALRRQNQIGSHQKNTYAEKFKAGFRQCAAEVGTFLGVLDQDTSIQVVKHLASCLNQIENANAPAEAASRQPNQINRPRPNVPVQIANPISATPPRSHQHHTSTSSQSMSPPPQMPPVPPFMSTVQQFQKPHTQKMRMPQHIENQIHTPPLSPKIDVDDSSVWRPW